MALGIEQCVLSAGDRVAMLGIGSGINCQMLSVEWERSRLETVADAKIGQSPDRDAIRSGERSSPAMVR